MKHPTDIGSTGAEAEPPGAPEASTGLRVGIGRPCGVGGHDQTDNHPGTQVAASLGHDTLQHGRGSAEASPSLLQGWPSPVAP